MRKYREARVRIAELEHQLGYFTGGGKFEVTTLEAANDNANEVIAELEGRLAIVEQWLSKNSIGAGLEEALDARETESTTRRWVGLRER